MERSKDSQHDYHRPEVHEEMTLNVRSTKSGLVAEWNHGNVRVASCTAAALHVRVEAPRGAETHDCLTARADFSQ